MKLFLEFLRWFFTMSFKADGIMIQWASLKNMKWSNGTRLRYFGLKDHYYDGPHYGFGLWFYHIVLSPIGSDLYQAYDYRKALEEAIQTNPQIHLLSSNELVRKAAFEHLRNNK